MTPTSIGKALLNIVIVLFVLAVIIASNEKLRLQAISIYQDYQVKQEIKTLKKYEAAGIIRFTGKTTEL
jgi:hypothetical protein